MIYPFDNFTYECDVLGAYDMDKFLKMKNSEERKQFVCGLHPPARRMWLGSFLCYALSSDFNPHISKENVEQIKYLPRDDNDVKEPFFKSFLKLCRYLDEIKYLDNTALTHVRKFLHLGCLEHERELFTKLLTKTLDVGITADELNEICPWLTPADNSNNKEV